MEYKIKITDQDLPVLSEGLGNLPFKISAPLIEKLNSQIAEQANKNTNAEKAKEEK